MKTLFIGTGSMGQNNSLLYWHPILLALSQKISNIHLYISHNFTEILPETIKIISPFKYFNLMGAKLPNPSFAFNLFRINPDIIIISEFGATSIIASIYKKLFTKKRIILLVENHPKFLAGYGTNRGGKFIKIRSFIANSADTIIASNIATRNYLIKDLNCNNNKIITAPYLTSVRKPQNLNSKKNKKHQIHIVSTGQAIRRKGFDYLINEISLLPENIKNKIKVKIIGDGNELLSLKKQSAALGLSNLITFTGKISYDDITNELADADIFVMPTRGDYRSLALFEALSAGLPLLGSCYDGSSEEVIKPGINGEIFDPNITGDLSNKILKLINSNKIEVYSNASKNISQQFSVEEAAMTLANAIKFENKIHTKRH